MSSHQHYMQRAIELAFRGRGYTKTNPMVGAVIVYKDQIIGEGFHSAYGQPHAEIAALQNVSKSKLPFLPESKMYVSLEPCSHYGKTPPCTNEIIKRQIPQVYIGLEDPFPKVSGRGIKMLRAAGVKVEVGIEEEACRQLLHRFRTQIELKRPFIHLKWAQSKDGFLSRKGEQTSISRKQTTLLVHRLRSMNDAILVGTHTLLTDNPRLDNRLYPGPTPIKIILDRKGRIDHKNHNFFRSKGKTLGIIKKGGATADLYDDIIYLPDHLDDQKQINYILDKCLERNIASIFVEGGQILLQEFIKAHLWDRADIIQATKVLDKGIRAPHVAGRKVKVTHSADDRIIQMQPQPIEH